MGSSRKFTANYTYTDSNFEISNLKNTDRDNKYSQVICVLLNLLQRGCPTKPSDFIHPMITDNQDELRYFSKAVPDWKNVIGGNDITNDYPAKTFLYDLVPKYLSKYPYLQELIIPEVLITEIVDQYNREFIDQRVDFYIPEFKLVIEVDGIQHRGALQNNLDDKRDKFLNDNGVKTLRVSANAIKTENVELKNFFIKFKEVLSAYKDQLAVLQMSYDLLEKKEYLEEFYKSTATIRFEVAILELCAYGMLSLEDKSWKLAIKNHEVCGYENAAIEDVFNWLENLCILAGLEFARPEVSIIQIEQFDEKDADYIKLEMSVTNRRNQLQNPDSDRIYITNCWRQDIDYFQMEISDAIKYVIDDSGVDQNANTNELNEKRVALRFLLKNIFGFDDFRPGQERIVINALKRRDTIGVLPTGSGKSLCYQMATLLQPCISFCICPIKSLMIDQDQNLKASGITRTAYISSDLTTEERVKTQKDFANNKLWWVFISPERFQDVTFRQYLLDMYQKRFTKFGYAVIDEVHCLSEWGHSFRVSYLNLIRTIRKYCPGTVLIGLTATASLNVLKNILVDFGMTTKEDVISIPSFTRPELEFEVINDRGEKNERLHQMLDRYLAYYNNLLTLTGKDARCGIIFTPYVNSGYGCYPLASELAHYYKADIRCFGGSEPKKWQGKDGDWEVYKKEAQADFKNNKYSLLCATKAFGMGIDKPNVRYTIHYGIPSSLEALYQEGGRAGRDKQKATCTILYSPEKAYRAEIEKCLSKDATADEVHEFLDRTGKKYEDQGDAYRQLFLLSNEMTDIEEETEEAKYILEKNDDTSDKIVIEAEYLTLNELQKHIYHLATIGVVDDWTVDWKTNTCVVSFQKYSVEDIFNKTENYIRNYDVDFSLDRDILRKGDGPEECVIKILKAFLTWYQDNILYSRRQALLNVMAACDAYTPATKEAFKERMEAYFRLDDIADLFGNIADEPRDVKRWFEVLNINKIKYHKVSNILMNLNRFLESYQNNVGLNFISGLLNMIDNHFESPNGRERLMSAIRIINTFDDESKVYITKESAKVMAGVSEGVSREIFSEFFIRNMDFDDVSRVIYKELEDNYSLQTIMNMAMVSMASSTEE